MGVIKIELGIELGRDQRGLTGHYGGTSIQIRHETAVPRAH